MKKVYICSSLRPEVYERVTNVLKTLEPAIHLRPWKDQTGNREGHVETDIAMIDHCDELWVVGEFGRDCSFEIGYAAGIKKPIVMFKDETNAKNIEQDWMILHPMNSGLLKIVDLQKSLPTPPSFVVVIPNFSKGTVLNNMDPNIYKLSDY